MNPPTRATRILRALPEQRRRYVHRVRRRVRAQVGRLHQGCDLRRLRQRRPAGSVPVEPERPEPALSQRGSRRHQRLGEGGLAFSGCHRRGRHLQTIYSFPTWFFDYDNDGFEDLFVSGYLIQDVGDVAADYLGLRHKAARPRLYRNLGNGTFTNLTASLRLDRVCHAMGCNFGDLDNDGWLDFYLGTGDPDFTSLMPNRMFRNAGGQYFQEVTTSGGFGNIQKGHGVGFADLDNDGDQDIYAVIGGAFVGDHYPNSLFMNPGHGHQWLKIRCVGTRSNRAAIGTRLMVTVNTPSGPRSIYKTVNSGGSFGSSPIRQEIGLGDAKSVAKLEVLWPASGLRQVFTNLQPNRFYQIREDQKEATEIALPPLPFDLTSKVSRAHATSPGPSI